MIRAFILVVSIALLWGAKAQNLAPLIQENNLGASFCKYLAWKMQIHHKSDCGEPKCKWDEWSAAMETREMLNNHTTYKNKERIIVSYSHNGFGNQLWSHTVALMAAESMNAKFYISNLPEDLRPDGQMPPNTWAGFDTVKRILPSKFIFDSLPEDSYEKELCDKETFIIADRPRDWRNKEYGSTFKQKLSDLLNDPNPRCMKFLGYFQNIPLCYEDAKAMWRPQLFKNFTQGPGPDDIAIYLRCVPRHYHFNGVEWYQSILERLEYNRIWLFQAPECPNEVGNDPARDGPVAQVVRYLKEHHNATKWPSAPDGSDDQTYLLWDLTGLSRAKRLILPVSSWAYWGGVFSDATEIHVNAPPKHPLMEYNGNLYKYHDEKNRLYFGTFNLTEYDLVYKVDLNKFTPSPTEAPSKPPTDEPPKYNATAAFESAAEGIEQFGDSYDLLDILRSIKNALNPTAS